MILPSGRTIRKSQVVAHQLAMHVGSDPSIDLGIARVMCPEREQLGPSIDRGRGIKSRVLEDYKHKRHLLSFCRLGVLVELYER